MAALPNNTGGNSNARKVLTTDPVHADIVNMSITQLDANIDAVNAESAATKSEVEAARSGEASLDARIDSVSGVASTVSSEVSTARNGEANLANRLAMISSLQPKEYQELQAELARQVVPSGWLTEIQNVVNGSIGSGDAGVIRVEQTWPNAIRCGKNDSIMVNGYKLTLPDVYFDLTDSPSAGARVDMVFLEMWLKDISNPASGSAADRRSAGLLDDGTLPVNGNVLNYSGGGVVFDYLKAAHRYQAQYRFRVVAGIDILTYPEGINHGAVVKAWPAHKRTSGDGVGEPSYTFSKSSTDAGLYVAGDGSSTAKTALGTSDGYVYAIPICAVHRRNSTAYHVVTNPNGSSVSASISNTSDRPDGLFYNGFAVGDVIDLRHQVSFSGFDYQKLLAEGISDLLTGNLKTMFVPGDGIGTPSDVFGTTHTYVEQVGGSDVNNINNRTTGNNSAITSMATNGQRRCWNDAAQTVTNHAKVSQTTTDLAAFYADYGVIRSAGTGTWDHSDALTITAPTWASVAAADVHIYDELGNEVTPSFNIAGSGNTATCTLQTNYSSTFTADAGSDQLTISSNSSWKTGARIRTSSTGTLPAGLAAATDYYVVVVNNTTVKLATSRANALAGTVIDITDAGTGTHTLTQQAPSFEAETNLHVVYNVTYPVGGGLVNHPTTFLRAEDSTGALLHIQDSEGAVGYGTEPAYASALNGLGLGINASNGIVAPMGAILAYEGKAATIANQISVTLPTGYTPVGIYRLYDESTPQNIEPYVVSWTFDSVARVCTITTSSSILVGTIVSVILYVDRVMIVTEKRTKAVTDIRFAKEITITTDASGNGAAYLDYNEVGIGLAGPSLGASNNIRNAATNAVLSSITPIVSSHKVTVSGTGSPASGSVKVTICVSKTIKNNEFLRVWYKYVPYMGIGQQELLYGNLKDSPGYAPKIVAAHDKILVSSIGTGGLPPDYPSNHAFQSMSARLPIGSLVCDYYFVGTAVTDKLAVPLGAGTGTGKSVGWNPIVNAAENDWGAGWGWCPVIKFLNIIGPIAKRGVTRIDPIDAVGPLMSSGAVHYSVVFALVRASSGKLHLATCVTYDPDTVTAQVWGWSNNNTGADFMFILGRPLIK
jgi:hypothetical protein